MTYGLWLSAAGMQANQYRQEVMTNNMANVTTVGFKKDLAVMRERLVEGKTAMGGRFGNDLLDNMSGGSFVTPTYHSFEAGPMRRTGNPLDAAVKGDAFFGVQVGNDVKYTRDGRFAINQNNELIMVANEGRAKVLDESGAPIALLPGKFGDPVVGANGVIRQGRQTVGKIGLFEFEDRNALRKTGGNLFSLTKGVAKPATSSSLMTEMVEGSTVDPVGGLATMIEVSRAYQLNAQMISLQDSTIGQSVSRLGRIG